MVMKVPQLCSHQPSHSSDPRRTFQPPFTATLGLAGAAQIFRLDQPVDYLRRGHVIKTTRETR